MNKEIVVDAPDADKNLFGAELSLDGLLKSHAQTKDFRNAFFRIELTDKYGKKALTRAYFLDELGF